MPLLLQAHNHARECRLRVEPDGGVHQVALFQRLLRDGQLAQHVRETTMLQVIETKGRDGLVGEQRAGLDDLAVHQEAADQPVVVAQTILGHTVGGQQQAGHLETTL